MDIFAVLCLFLIMLHLNPRPLFYYDSFEKAIPPYLWLGQICLSDVPCSRIHRYWRFCNDATVHILLKYFIPMFVMSGLVLSLDSLSEKRVIKFPRTKTISSCLHCIKCISVSGSLVHNGHTSDATRPHFLLMLMVFRKLCKLFWYDSVYFVRRPFSVASQSIRSISFLSMLWCLS